MQKKIIYADNAATTKLDIDAFEAMKQYLLEEYGNASQPYSFSRKSKQALREARDTIARCINAEPEEIYFTSGGTESDNWALKGSAFFDPLKRATITSAIEHHAILNACADIEKLGYPARYLPVTSHGMVSPEMLSKQIGDDTRLVSIMFANNEIGTIQDIQTLCGIAHSKGAIFHTDAVQAVGHVPIDVKSLGVDMLSASAHKFNGPKGIGFLYMKSGTKINPYISGGKQEFGMRAGTENVASIVGMAVALKNNADRIVEARKHLRKLEESLLQELNNCQVDFIRNGENHLPGNLSLSFKGANGETLLHRLDLMGIMVSTGSACDSVTNQVSHVLRAISLGNEYAEGTIRISLSHSNTVEEVQKIARAIIKILQ